MEIDFVKIKLVIWDLDDTFWHGTISEEEITPIKENIELVKRLTDIGIINAICSKNSEEPVLAKLKELSISDYFVFNSINWEPKGKRISQMIRDMGLRPVNVLFIDDNEQNLNEALFYEPHLMTSLPEIIKELNNFALSRPISDVNHKRLKQYQILEQKNNVRKKYSDNIEFLYSTNTQVCINRNCLDNIDRLYELVQRTNQLNFTKKRSTKNELLELLKDKTCDSGYVTVSDKFGDYGIVGFFAVKNNRCVHFLFSCRTIGQGVEQYVYSQLHYPSLDVVGDVVNNVDDSPSPAWINQKVNSLNVHENLNTDKDLIIIKGACDLDILSSFLSSKSIKTEFTYIGEKHNCIEHHNHSVNILQWHYLNQEQKQQLLDSCCFNDKHMFDTRIFDDNVDLVFLSSQIEPNLGIYQNKKSRIRLAFAEWCYPLTDRQYWDDYINHTIPSYGNNFTREGLEKFANEWVYIGQISANDYVENIKKILKIMNKNAKLCVLLGSEIPYEANKQKAYENRHLIYKQFNDCMRKLAEEEPRLLLLPFGDYIKGQEDFLDNINHYQRRVYFEAAKLAKLYIQNMTKVKIHSKNILTLWLDQFASLSRKNIRRNSYLFKLMKMIYRILRR